MTIIVLLILGGIGYWAYKNGKLDSTIAQIKNLIGK